jgi:hypothetical protein
MFQDGTVTVRERVEAYVAKHPTAKSGEVAKALDAHPKTVFNYMKGYGQRDKAGNLPKPISPLAARSAPTVLDVLKLEEARLQAILDGVKVTKGELAKVKAAIKALEG